MIDWHYPRTDLAKRTLSLLADGPAQALTLFGPRRSGKTEFLTLDLGPLAESQGHRVIYASFWQAPLAPIAVLLHALEQSRRKGNFADRVRSTAVGISPKLALSAPLPGSGTKVTLDLTKINSKPPENLLLYLDDLLDRLASKKKRTILLLDEVQELAREEDNRSLVAALRTSLDKRRDELAAVFTGSSKQGLQSMFAKGEAPFFRFATPIDLPQLGEGFVDHLLKAFETATKRALDRNDAVDAFKDLHHNPEYFQGLMSVLLANPALDIKAAVQKLREQIATDLNYPKIWLSLSSLQRATALAIARGADKPYSQETREEIGTFMNEKPPSIQRVQGAIRKLKKERILENWFDEWVIDDPEFASWIKRRPKSDY